MKTTNKTETIGLYGGTFSPPHIGHIRLAEAFCERFRPDRLIIMPAAIPPHKKTPSGVTPVQRFEMTKLAFEDMNTSGALVTVSDYELKNTDEKSYTYNTVRYLKTDQNRIFLLCGTDMIMTFDKWYRSKDILSMCEPVYAYRNNDDPMSQPVIEKKIDEYRTAYSAVIHRLDIGITEISSSRIRAMLASGEDASEFLPQKVLDYIGINKLYENE